MVFTAAATTLACCRVWQVNAMSAHGIDLTHSTAVHIVAVSLANCEGRLDRCCFATRSAQLQPVGQQVHYACCCSLMISYMLTTAATPNPYLWPRLWELFAGRLALTLEPIGCSYRTQSYYSHRDSTCGPVAYHRPAQNATAASKQQGW